MKQNIYDDPTFFTNYSAMPRSTGGLDAAGEWPVLRAMLPDLTDKHVLDLGCGFGWHCRYARSAGAASVVGVDLSENMLARARAMTDDPAIDYRRVAIEDLDFPAESFDVVLSSLAFHYVADIAAAFAAVRRVLKTGGRFVLSVEHPVFTARAEQNWFYGPDGEILHWPVDDYQAEGIRHASWLADDVVKYHRTVASWINTLIDSGFAVARIAEPGVTEEAIAERPDLKHENRRPIFLLMSAVAN